MRRSPKRHPLATLRLRLGLTQKEMGNLAGVAAVTIKKIETGQLGLSGKLAEHIAMVTNVDEEWLVSGDPKGEIIAEDGTPYTRAHFEDRQAMMFARNLSKERKMVEHEFTPEVLALALGKIYGMIQDGHAKGRFVWTIYKIQMALLAVERELGRDENCDWEQMIKDLPEHGVAKLREAVERILKAHGGGE
jgi:transcriptional regulator with XRE-family HTH domain